jgi:hypothetical protein
MKQIFPFGRGDRGSRQRLVLELGTWGATLRVSEISIKVLRTHEPVLTVVRVGISTLNGVTKGFFTSQILATGQTIVQALKDFHTVRHNNKVWQRKRRLHGGIGIDWS